MLELTKSDGYKPTNAEKKLLDVMLQPDNFKKNVTEICEIAGVSRETYYDSLKKQEFVNLIPNTVLQIISGHTIQLINATLKAALSGSFNDRKLLLEMSGIVPRTPSVALQQNTVNNYNYTHDDLLTEAYKLVAEDKKITVEELRG